MPKRRIFRAVRPFISALAVIATAAILVFTIYFTEVGSQWITFLTGILVAAILAETTRRSHAEWVVMRRTAQLSSIKTRLEHETQLRKIAEKAVAADKPRLHLIDEVLPTMVALVDRTGHCQYHNRAFLDWLRLRPEQINGRHMRDVLGAKVYQETATAVRQSLDGHAVHYERTQKMPDGAVYRLSVEHFPQFGEDGKVTGFYMLINDITEPGDVRMPALPDSSADQSMFVDSYSEQITAQHDANLIRRAIENGEFSLFCQLITPLAVNSGAAGHYEILVRLMEEEEGMMPPGMFFPLAEKHGLMPHLDRWVVQHVTEWVAHQNPQAGQRESSMYFINVSGATIADTGFPEFLHLTLLEYGVPGTSLCFEITDSELALRTAEVAEFARQVRQCGCRVALSGFGRDRVLFDLIRGFQVEFLKIEGSIILDILRDPVKLAKVIAINRVAKKIGVQTIAELVESEETIAKLREIGIDFAQGFGISRPRPLKE
ncbi:MAG: EAL domain-containing protein [Gallionella sp.]